MADAPPSAPAAEGVISKPSGYTVEQSVRRIEEAARAKGLTIFARIDHAAGARAASLEMSDAQLLILGDPRAGTPLMVARPLVALDLPLRVLVWRAPDGRVWATYQDSAFIARRFSLPEGLEKNIAGFPRLIESALR